MELNIVKHKTFKKIFFNFLVICMLIIIGGFVLYKSSTPIFPQLLLALSFKNVFFYVAIGLTLIFVFYIINNKKKIKHLKSIEEKISQFEKFYTWRLWWHVVSCLTTILFLLLTWHILFLYFALFDLLSMFNTYPSKEMLKKELGEEDLIFN